jgi:tRNA (guanine37-N1)-methyltransferase
LLEYPQYTRPADFRGMQVPEVLLNGHHAKIQAWRKEQARLKTALNRPDLLTEQEGDGDAMEAPDDAWL